MKIRYLGTCSGTEPMKDMHHCSLIIEVGDTNYWFDAGENCAHTAYTSGVDFMNTKCLFISHPHTDHVAGLPALFACLCKLTGRYKLKMKHANTLHIYTPDDRIVPAALVLGGEVLKKRINICEHGVSDGLLYEDENVKITASHNAHLRENGENGWHSFSYLIESEGLRVVFSGDVLEPSELDSLIGCGCDLLIMETGHHPVAEVCEYAASHGVKTLRFNHHGREILENREAAEEYVRSFAASCGMDIALCYDGMVETLQM